MYRELIMFDISSHSTVVEPAPPPLADPWRFIRQNISLHKRSFPCFSMYSAEQGILRRSVSVRFWIAAASALSNELSSLAIASMTSLVSAFFLFSALLKLNFDSKI